MLKRVVDAMQKIAPLSLAEVTWDNVGILIDAPFPKKSAKVMLTIDLTSAVLQECIDQDVSVIVAYHPPIFKPFKKLSMSDEKQRIAMICVAKGISVYSPHTALDNVKGGINDWLASGLGPGVTKSIKPYTEQGISADDGSGRIHILDAPVSKDQLIDRVKRHLNLKTLRYAHGVSPQIKSVAICAGSGSSVLSGVEADAWLTGEMSHHDVLAAQATGTSVILCEHTNTERGYLKSVLQQRLSDLLNEGNHEEAVQILVSELDKDPIISV